MRVSTGWDATLFVKSSGEVITFGTNTYNTCGVGHSDPQPTPVYVLTENGILQNIISVSAGPYHSLACDSNGEVWAWGSNVEGECGFPVDTIPSLPYAKKVPNLSNVKDVVCGHKFSLILKTDGTVWGFGSNVNRVLTQTTFENFESPVQVMRDDETPLSDIQKIRAFRHCGALDSLGNLYLWGYSTYGQIGNGLRGYGSAGNLFNAGLPASQTYVQFPFLAKENVKEFALGYHTLVVLNDGATEWTGMGAGSRHYIKYSSFTTQSGRIQDAASFRTLKRRSINWDKTGAPTNNAVYDNSIAEYEDILLNAKITDSEISGVGGTPSLRTLFEDESGLLKGLNDCSRVYDGAVGYFSGEVTMSVVEIKNRDIDGYPTFVNAKEFVSRGKYGFIIDSNDDLYAFGVAGNVNSLGIGVKSSPGGYNYATRVLTEEAIIPKGISVSIENKIYGATVPYSGSISGFDAGEELRMYIVIDGLSTDIGVELGSPIVVSSGQHEFNSTLDASILNDGLHTAYIYAVSTADSEKTNVFYIEFDTDNSKPIATSVAITGNPSFGQNVIGKYTYEDNNPEAISIYKWYQSDTVDGSYIEIEGATQVSFLLTEELLGKYIKFEVTPKSIGGDSMSNIGIPVQSAAMGPIAYAITPPEAKNLVLTGQLVVGQSIIGSYEYFDLNDDPELNSEIKWYRGDSQTGPWVESAEAAGSLNYTLTESDLNKWIKFEVTPKNASEAGETVSVVSDTSAQYGEAPPVANNVVIVGEPEIGQTLVGNYEYFDINGDAEGASTFKWLRADTVDGAYTAIPGATAKEYVVSADDLGKWIKFEVTPMSV